MPNIRVKRCTVLNPSTLFPTPADGDPHNCVASINQVCTPRPDLADTLENAEPELFVDRSASHSPDTGEGMVGFAVAVHVTQHETLLSGKLPSHYSAQAAEQSP